MKIMYAGVFTGKRHLVIIMWFGVKCLYLRNQRRLLTSPQDITPEILAFLLNDYFPGIEFIPRKKNGGGQTALQDNLSILNYVDKKNGAWVLDLSGLSKSREKHFACLFPGALAHWEEDEARKRYGCANVIRYYIDAENDKFLHEFKKLKNAASIEISGKNILNDFFKNFEMYNKTVWEEWNFSDIVVHKLRHHPPTVYEAFGYYGHRYYTLYGFGLDSSVDLQKCTEADLLESGNTLLDDAIQKNIDKLENILKNNGAAFFEIKNEALESVPKGKSIYEPTALDILIKQIKNKIPNLYKASSSGENTDMYTGGDRKNINNHINKLEGLLDSMESLSALRKLKMSGTYREKINMLYQFTLQESIRSHYDMRELTIIHGLYLKQFRALSLDRRLDDDEDKETFTGHDALGDNKYLDPGDQAIWASFFKDEFEKELDEKQLGLFLQCLPGHFAQYPFDLDSSGGLTLSKYSRKILFTTFCSIAGIAPDNELWKPFLVLIQNVLAAINRGAEYEGALL